MGAAGKHQLLPRRRRLQPVLHPGPEDGGEPRKHVWDIVPSQHRQGLGLARQRCRCCLAVVKGSGLMIKKKPCPGSSAALKQLVNDPKGHTLVACDACPGFVMACSKCGRYTTGGAIKPDLRAPCVGRMNKNAAYDWRRLAVRGLHPTCNVAVGPPIPVGRL